MPGSLTLYAMNAFLLSLILLAAANKHDTVCSRCESRELNDLRKLYNNLGVVHMNFRQFLTTVIQSMEGLPDLATMRIELVSVIESYDDCIRACEIPFTKRFAPRSTELGHPRRKPFLIGVLLSNMNIER
ncbi:hypothetical protein CAPTEDRAFT_224782 [Capitella teleta]|uniref:Uncharacterized protein n=1 Tax=Capitella teleta TaxID=283909 RepID=R7TIW9_CAPTE|nr:hypothetical protein CAPTEDRAFT_224782 [Capitella teleta]|eukprot:ELT93664.1 hypothetical protein CAPTEDRAFT_224782 [Capitella teleta]